MKTEELKKTVFEALGEASMCWSETPKGVFESSRAEEIGNRVMRAIEETLTDQDLFICKACNCTVPKNYCHKTERYCYLCDPNITLLEALSENHTAPTSLPSDEEIGQEFKFLSENWEIRQAAEHGAQWMRSIASAKIAEIKRVEAIDEDLQEIVNAIKWIKDLYKDSRYSLSDKEMNTITELVDNYRRK